MMYPQLVLVTLYSLPLLSYAKEAVLSGANSSLNTADGFTAQLLIVVGYNMNCFHDNFREKGWGVRENVAQYRV